MVISLDTSLRLPKLDGVSAAAKQAEADGYGGMWAGEAGSRDPFIRLALASTATTRIQLGTSIAISFVRSPMVLAQLSWDLADVTRGRFVLGLGTQVKGHNERRFSVPWLPPGPRMRDLIGCLRAIWASWQFDAPADFRSDHYQYTLNPPSAKREPLENPFADWAGRLTGVPVWLAGVNPYMCRLAGEMADGFVLHPLNSAKYLTEMVLPELEAGARKAGRPLSTIPILNMPFVVTGRDDRELAYWTDVVKRQIAYYASTRTYTRIMELHGWADIPARLHEMTSAGRWDDLPTIISDEMLETFAVVGAPSEIPRMLFERYDGLVSRLSLYHGEVPVERTALLAAFAGA